MIPMIDTLIFSLDFQDYDERFNFFIDILERKRNEAQLAATNCTSDITQVEIADHYFQVLPNGSKGYAYILHNDSYEINFSRYRSKKADYYPIKIRVKSSCLWSKGYLESYNDILYLLITSFNCTIIAEKLSRIDLCCHTDKLTIPLEKIKCFKGSFYKDSIYRNRRRVTGVNFGSRKESNVYCRIYDKSQELADKRDKLWFKDIWQEHHLEVDNIWNIEFELKRKFFNTFGIETVQDAFERLKSIWIYCTKQYIQLVDLVNTRIERCPINETWIQIQDAFNHIESKPLIAQEKQLLADAACLLPSTLGNLTSYAARIGTSDMKLALKRFERDSINYLYKVKFKDFEQEVDEKRQLLDEQRRQEQCKKRYIQ